MRLVYNPKKSWSANFVIDGKVVNAVKLYAYHLLADCRLLLYMVLVRFKGKVRCMQFTFLFTFVRFLYIFCSHACLCENFM